MLATLRVRNLGAVDDVAVDLHPGLNVLTGETGAGKTLLIEALHLVLGGGDRHLPVRDPSAPSGVDALFVGDLGAETLLARELPPGGRLRASIDGATVSAQMLAERSAHLCELHGQHEHQILRAPGAALSLLDRAFSIETTAVADLRHRRNELLAARERLGGSAADRARSIELAAHELAEIDDVAPSGPDELTTVLDELSTLSSVLEAADAVRGAADAIDSDADQPAAASFLAAALALLPAAMAELRTELSGLLVGSRDLAGRLRRELEGLEADPERLDTLNARAERLQALVRRHGHSLDDVLARRDELAKTLAALAAVEDEARDVAALLEQTAAALEAEERTLAAARSKAAARLASDVQSRLAPLAMPHATFDVRVEGPAGERVTFLFSGSSSFAPAPLADAASGGELSRVMLALTLATRAGASCIVFDEVDAGVGGATARSLAACLAETARDTQVVVITHLATVAAVAAHHIVVERGVRAAEPATVRRVTGDERVAEIARMLAGDPTDPLAISHAAALLAEASATA